MGRLSSVIRSGAQRRSQQFLVGVGITIAHDPLHGSGRAVFPHPALALGDDAHAPQRIRRTDRRQRQPARDEAAHAIPENAAVLAPPRQRALPKPSDLESKQHQRRFVHGHSVVAKVSTHNRPQPLALFGDGCVHASLKFGFHLIQLRLQPLAYRLPQDRKLSIAPFLHADVRKAQEVERFRFPFSASLPVVDRVWTELQQSRFLGMQFQVKLLHTFREFRPKLIGIRFAVKSNPDVVSETHHDDVAVRPLLTPRLDPQVEHVMKINVSQQRRCTAALGRSFVRACSFPILQHAGVEPFLDQAHDAPICYPVLDEFHQPFVRQRIEKAANIQIQHPVHFSRQQSRVERVQRLMLAASRPEPVRESLKVRLVDSVQHFDGCALDDFVFQHGHSERPFPPIVLFDVRPTHRLRSIRSSLQPMGEILEIVLEGLAVVPPRLSIHSGRGFLLQSEVSPAQRFRVVDVVQKRREPQLLILDCCLTYPLQRTERVFPARCPGRVLLGQIPFGQASPLHLLRRRLPGFVRRLLRYFRSVRLPRSVRHRRTSLDFPMRPRATAALGEPGISRFPFEVLLYVHGVCDRAGLQCTSRYRCTGWSLPHLLTASASRSKFLTRLNTRPARSLVNASTPPSRAAPHDSGPMWVATSHSCDSFIHYTSPVYPAHKENTMQVQSDYFNAYHNLKLTRDDKGVLVAEFHTDGGPCIMTAQSHTEFVDGFYRISQDRANKIVILTGAGGEFITDVDWSSFGNAADPGVWSQVHDEGVQVLENIANIRVPVIAAIEGRAHVHSDYALLASVIVAGDGTTFQDVAHFSQGVAPGDGIFTTWSYRAGAGRAEAFLLNPQPLAAQTAHEWGVVAEVVPNGKALSRARELATLYLKPPKVTRRNTRIHFIQPLKERIVREAGYVLSPEGASATDLVKSMQAKSEPVAQKEKVA